MYLSFQLQMNQKERVISEFQMGFKKSRFSSSLNSIYTRSENGHGFKKTGLKRVWDFNNRAAHANQKFQGIPPQPPGLSLIHI